MLKTASNTTGQSRRMLDQTHIFSSFRHWQRPKSRDPQRSCQWESWHFINNHILGTKKWYRFNDRTPVPDIWLLPLNLIDIIVQGVFLKERWLFRLLQFKWCTWFKKIHTKTQKWNKKRLSFSPQCALYFEIPRRTDLLLSCHLHCPCYSLLRHQTGPARLW